MKRLLISAFAFSLATAAPTVLLAQDDHHDQSAPHGAMSGPPADHGTPAGGDHNTMMEHHTTPMQGTGGTGSTHHTYHHTTHHTTIHHTTVIKHTTVHAKVDITAYRKAFNAPNHYHYGDYHGPAGYSYHRWNTGDNLPREYWAQNYWINNFLNFGLIAPPDGYVWVRYGPDALLIDEDTGEVIQVVYGVFY